MFHLTMHKRAAARGVSEYFERWCAGRDESASAYYLGDGDERQRAVWRTFGAQRLGVNDGDAVHSEDLHLMLRGVDKCGYFLVDPTLHQLEALSVSHAQVRTFRDARTAGSDVCAAGQQAGLSDDQARDLDVVLRGWRAEVRASIAALGVSVERAVQMADVVEPATRHAAQVKALDARILEAEKAGKTTLRADLIESRGKLLAKQGDERRRIVKTLRAQFQEVNDQRWEQTLDFYAMSGQWLAKGRVDKSALGRVLSGRKVPVESTVADQTFSAPKSVSVLLGLLDAAGREKVIALHSAAVQVASDALLEQAARTRTGRGGAMEHTLDAARAAAVVQIDSRTGGIHLHTHLLLDLAAMSGARVGALSQQALYDAGKNAGLLYQAQLRHNLSQAFPGIEWTSVTNGLAEIANIPDHLLQAFSERTFDILLATREAQRIQKEEPHAWEILTRVKGDFVYFEGLRIRADRVGVRSLSDAERADLDAYAEFGQLVERLEDTMTPAENRLLARLTRPDKNADAAHESEVLAKFSRDLDAIFGPEHAQQVRAEVETGMVEADEQTLAQRKAVREQLPDIVARGIDSVAREHGSLNESMVFDWVVNHTPGGAVSGTEIVAEVDATFARLVAEGKVLEIRESKRNLGWLAANRKSKGNQYTTTEVVSLEYAVDDWAHRQAGATPRTMTREEFVAMQAELAATPLNIEQRAFAEAVCSGRRGLVVVEAPAGTGKSFALGACRPTLTRQGRFVVGLAPMNVAAAQLRDAVDVSMSVDLFLTLIEAGVDVTRFGSGAGQDWQAPMVARHRAELAGVIDVRAREDLARRHADEWEQASAVANERRDTQVRHFWDTVADGMDTATAERMSKARSARSEQVARALRTQDWSRVDLVRTSIDADGAVVVVVGDKAFHGRVSADEARRLSALRQECGIGLARGERREVAMTVVVDEAGMLGTEKFAGLVGACQEVGAEQIVLMGDSRQLSAVRSASGLFTRISQTTSTECDGVQFQLREVARARQDWEKQAQIAMHDAQDQLSPETAAEVAATYAQHDRLTTVDSSAQAHKEALAWYKQARSGSGQERKTALMIASTNAAADKLNALYVAECERNSRRIDTLKASEARGELTKRQEAELTRRLTSGLDYIDTTTSYTVDASWGHMELRKGERISFRANDLRKGISNKDLATVEAFDPKAGTVAVRLEATGRVVALDSHAKAWGDSTQTRVRHGYASTVHSAQGVTVDEACLVVTGGQKMSAELVYVAMSRGRDHNGVIVVGSEEWTAQDFLTGSMLNRDTPESVLTLIERVAREELDDALDPKARSSADTAARELLAERLKGHSTDWDEFRATPGGTENHNRGELAMQQREAQQVAHAQTVGMDMAMSR